MNVFPSFILGSRRRSALVASLLLVLLSACGGGSSDRAQVVTLSAGNVSYSRAMVVTVNGSGLDEPGLQMTVDGSCGAISQAPGPTDSQTQFGCQLRGVGDYQIHIRRANGDELARLKVEVPNPRVLMSLSQGSVKRTLTVELDPRAAPSTTLNFLRYVGAGFYNGTIIHRVVPGTLAQGGGYTPGPTYKEPLYDPLVFENTGLPNLRGTIAMARALFPDSATSQFYFNIKDNPGFDRISELEPGYAVFGRVVEGLEVLDEIGQVPTRITGEGLLNVPVTDVVVDSVIQVR